MSKKKCGSTETSTGKPCGRAAGTGTEHFGAGFCSYHEVSMLEKYNINLTQVEVLAASGMPIESETAPDVCDFYGIVKSTFYEICDRHPELLEHYKRGKARAIAGVGKTAFKRAQDGTNFQWSKFYLQCQGGWKPTEGRELSTPPGRPLEIEEKENNYETERVAEILGQLAGISETPGGSET